MRNLTIKRRKSFVGSLMKVKVYIEDSIAGDILINNISCRKIGDLKNGEEKTFQIGEEAAKIFVIADKLSKDYCNDCFLIPAGQGDLFLSGKCKFNLANGNAFRFDNNPSEGMLGNRKKGTKKGLIVLCVAIVIGVAAGYLIRSSLLSSQKVKPKVFSDNGMSITLTNEFRSTKMESYTNCYGSAKVAVFALKESASLFDDFEHYTLEQYGNLVLKNNGRDSLKLKHSNGLTFFEYDFANPDTKDTYHYFSFIYKAEDAFWLVQFATRKDHVDEYSEKIIGWASTVEFS